MTDLLQETTDAIFAKACTSERIDAAVAAGWDAELWAVLQETGLTEFGVSEGSLLDVATVVRAAGGYAAVVPLAETLVARWLVDRLGADVAPGPLPVAIGGSHVPYGRIGSCIVVYDGHAWLTNDCVRTGTNLAGEPRDDIGDDHAANLGAVSDELQYELLLRLVLLRAVLLAGAAERGLELTVKYVREREAFGRPIAQFQAVQQQVAQMAAEVALMRASSDGAVLCAEQTGVPASELAIASAFATCASAAGAVAKIAHQMHGAIGYTYEHVLRHSTLRLWSWRDECGGEAVWAARVGALTRNAGGQGLWAELTGLC